MNNVAIVVIAYNREDSLNRILNSLLKADYSCTSKTNGTVPLIISIDKSDNNRVSEIANEFLWPYGEKRVVLHDENLGLKKHVLECGNYVDEFENIIVLEDDLYVSNNFYSYASSALNFVKDDEKIAGVSLYNHLLNVHVREPFEAIYDGFDNYYMQFAQSWGQAYTKAQWHGFLNWMSAHEDEPVSATNVPENVSSWSDKSWLKYYIKYVIDTDKYFIYPRVSHTTNFGDEGTHATSGNSDLQVPIDFAVIDSEKKRDLFFSKLDESKAIYDAFYENTILKDVVSGYIGDNNLSKNIGIDLYGYKPEGKYKYLLSSKLLPYKVIKSFGRRLRPVDANILNSVSGNDFYLYDTSERAEKPTVNEAGRILYNYRALSVKKMIEVIKYRLLRK